MYIKVSVDRHKYLRFPLLEISKTDRSSNYCDLLSQDSDIFLNMAHYLSDVALKGYLRVELKEKVTNIERIIASFGFCDQSVLHVERLYVEWSRRQLASRKVVHTSSLLHYKQSPMKI